MKKSSGNISVGRANHQDSVEYLYASLKQVYQKSFVPLEEYSNFADFFSPIMADNDIDAKPFVLLVGQYSVGKTSFINHLLGDRATGYPGSNVGPEPTTDRFVAIMHGPEERVLPGNAVAVSPSKPFKGLQVFGNAFLQKFECAEMRAEALEAMTLIDTPGVLSGEKQRIGRNYDMPQVCRWFAERSDLILLLFDAHKLDISDEFKTVVESLRGNDDKIRIVLNKSDQVTPQQLMRVYGALMWSLGKVFRTPEVTRVYISSYWNLPYAEPGRMSAELFDKEKADLFRDLRDIPKNAAVRRVNELVKRARTCKVHALVCACLRKMMPAMFGKEKKQKELLDSLEVIFMAVAQEHGISPGDFPDAAVYKEKLIRWAGTGRTLANLPKLNKELIKKLDDCLANDIPPLLRPLSLGPADPELDARSLPPARSRPANPGDEQESARAPWSADAPPRGQVPPNPLPAATPATHPSAGGGPSKGPPPPLPSKPAAMVQAKVVVALHAYTADAEGELTMEKGDEITVTDEGDNSGWWKGTVLARGTEGWFPSNYCQALEHN